MNIDEVKVLREALSGAISGPIDGEKYREAIAILDSEESARKDENNNTEWTMSPRGRMHPVKKM